MNTSNHVVDRRKEHSRGKEADSEKLAIYLMNLLDSFWMIPRLPQ